MQPKDQRDAPGRSRDLRQEITEGLLYTHSRLNANTSMTLEAASFLHALIELLSEKGLVGPDREGMLQVQHPLVETSHRVRVK